MCEIGTVTKNATKCHFDNSWKIYLDKKKLKKINIRGKIRQKV